jgi:hypothetical protein
VYSDSKEWYLDAYISPRRPEKKGVSGTSRSRVFDEAFKVKGVSGYCVSTPLPVKTAKARSKNDRASQTPADETL